MSMLHASPHDRLLFPAGYQIPAGHHLQRSSDDIHRSFFFLASFRGITPICSIF
jgi:hypothetical protein